MTKGFLLVELEKVNDAMFVYEQLIANWGRLEIIDGFNPDTTILKLVRKEIKGLAVKRKTITQQILNL
jgi:hypothetical protein